jgi:hypothetical protein
MVINPICIRRTPDSPFKDYEKIWQPGYLIASPCILDLNATKVRILHQAVFPLWDRVNTAKHEIVKIKIYWSRTAVRSARKQAFAKITSAPQGEKIRSETCMQIDLCESGNPCWVHVWYGVTKECYEYNVHPRQGCDCDRKSRS